jgi:hypothetical protein
MGAGPVVVIAAVEDDDEEEGLLVGGVPALVLLEEVPGAVCNDASEDWQV